MTKIEAKQLFILAGFQVKDMKELPNGYWPVEYAKEREESPWWFVETEFGWIEIGWRRRVISIDWKHLGISCRRFTEDVVTHTECGIHAWGTAKAVEYLSILRSICIQEKHHGNKSNDAMYFVPDPGTKH